MGGGNVEHIIVDDGSSDDTPSIIENYAKQHPHIVFIKFPQNRGTNAARNAAIKAAQGEWCIILDSDDYFVDDALMTISKTMEEKSGYKHYMFAPDDMQLYYKANPIIKGAAQKVLLYPDFLNGYIGGDFIHVCNTAILRKYPFDERLRIYEGVFFLMFFRDAQQMLFTNKVVTIRERQREDSVSRDVLRTNIDVIKKNLISQELRLKYFEDDLKSLGMTRKLHSLKIALFESYLLLGKYDDAKNLKITHFSGKKEKILHLISSLHLGWCFRLFLQSSVFFRYKLLNKKMKI